MNRALIIASSEFLSLVRTKFFIAGILMMPVLVGASFGFQMMANSHVDRQARLFGVIDHTGVLAPALERAADEHNIEMADGPAQKGPHFVARVIDLSGRRPEDARLEASNEVKHKTLFAFVEIPATVLDPASVDPVVYYTEAPSYDELPSWLDKTLGTQIQERRLQDAGIDPRVVAQSSKRVPLAKLALVERNADGTVSAAHKVDGLATIVLPVSLMYLLFLSTMSGAPHLMNAVIEEKMSKISEVLIASVTPFQLMMGKLLGTAAVSVLLALVYLLGGIYAILSSGRVEMLSPVLLAWFLLFLLCAVLMFGSLFLSVGAAASDIKDAQGMMQPMMALVILPMVFAFSALRAPDSGLAIAASIFPTSAPFIMLLRLAMPPGPPMWQLALSVLLMLSTVWLLVWAASRVFRVGLLMQGKGATLAEMIRWIRA